MYFSSTSKDISIYTDQDGHTFLYATCQRKDGSWVKSSIQLDGNIGYRREYNCLSIVFFAWDNVPWPLSLQMKPGTLKLRGQSLLTGTLIDDFGGHETSLCLDFCFNNNDGKLEYDGLPKDVRQRMVKYTCQNGDVVLRGLVLKEDGRLRYSDELNLADHYENADGYIKQKKDGNFFMTASDWVVGDDFELHTVMVSWSHGGGNRSAAYPLYKDIHVGDDGRLGIDDPVEHGLFDLDGPFMRFLEGLPIVGYYIAEIDFLEGDEEEGVRALKECTYSTICLAASIAGATLGGPLGAALGSAISTLVAPYVQDVFPQTAADGAFHKKVTAFSIFKVLEIEVLTVAGIGIGEISSAFGKLLADELMEQGWSSLFASMTAWLGKKALNTLTKDDMKLIVDTVVYAIENGLGEDYIREQMSEPQSAGDLGGYNGDLGDSLPGEENKPGNHIPGGRI